MAGRHAAVSAAKEQWRGGASMGKAGGRKAEDAVRRRAPLPRHVLPRRLFFKTSGSAPQMQPLYNRRMMRGSRWFAALHVYACRTRYALFAAYDAMPVSKSARLVRHATAPAKGLPHARGAMRVALPSWGRASTACL